jgi:hypothetical protein
MSATDVFDRIFEVGRWRPRRKRWWQGYPPIPRRKSAELAEVDGGFDKPLPLPRDRDPDPAERDGAKSGDGRNGDLEASPRSPLLEDLDEDDDENGDDATDNDGADEYGRPTRMLVEISDASKRNKQMKHMGWAEFQKKGGFVTLRKRVEDGQATVDKEFAKAANDLANTYAARVGKSLEQVLTSGAPRDLEVRYFLDAVKHAGWGYVNKQQDTGRFAGMELMPFTPRFTHERDVGNPKTTLQQSADLIAEMKRRSPELSDTQAYERAYAANPGLVEQAAREARRKLPRVNGRAVGE